MTLSTPVPESPALFGARWLSPEWLRRDEGDRPVIMGLAPLRARTTDRRIVLRLPGEPERIFRIDLPASPPFGRPRTEWQPVAQVTESPARGGPRIRPRSAIASTERSGSRPRRIVRALARDGHVVDVAFAQAGVG